MLNAYRVLDLTDEKGYLCGKVLSDLGMEVIKVERPGGDPGRNHGPFYHSIPDQEKSLYWYAYNTNKKSITLDVSTADGQTIFQKLAAKADFVIESFAPGYMDTLGLGYENLSKINPRIIMTSITPFGQTGPYKDYKASDLTLNAMSGLMSIVGDPDRPPLTIGADQAYCYGGLQAAAGTLIAHQYRETSGEGQIVDVSIQEALVVTLWITLSLWNLNQVIWSREGLKRRRNSTKKQVFFRTKDGYVAWEILSGRLGASTNALVELMDKEGLAGELVNINWRETDFDQIDQSQLDRYFEMFGEIFASHTTKDLHEAALAKGILLMPVNSIKEVIESEQLKLRNFWKDVEHPELGDSFIYPRSVLQFNQEPRASVKRAPLIGEHNLEIYQDVLGLTSAQIVALKQSQVI